MRGKKNKTLVGSLAKKKEGRKEMGREAERGQGKKLKICLYFLRYHGNKWEQVGTWIIPLWLRKRAWEGVQSQHSIYWVQNVMTSFRLQNLNPFSGSCHVSLSIPKAAPPSQGYNQISKLKSLLFSNYIIKIHNFTFLIH